MTISSTQKQAAALAIRPASAVLRSWVWALAMMLLGRAMLSVLGRPLDSGWNSAVGLEVSICDKS
jgi:hypothetical protein